MAGHKGFAGLALILASAAAIWAWSGSSTFYPRKVVAAAPAAPFQSRNALARRVKLGGESVAHRAAAATLGLFGAWAVGIVFLMFAIRSYCWVLWVDGNNLKIQSPNNLGDLALHITYIKYFANGVALWPDNPIHAFSKLRYPAGIDFFDSLLLLQHIDLVRALVWTGLLGSVATFYAFYRWGGAFAVAGFLFNGGMAGFEFFHNLEFSRLPRREDRLEKHSPNHVRDPARPALRHSRRLTSVTALAPKIFSRCRAMNRSRYGAGLCHGGSNGRSMPPCRSSTSTPSLHSRRCSRFGLIIGDWEMRKQIAILLVAAFLPATWIVWMITDHFQAKSILGWAPGWLQSDPAFSNPALFASKLRFWWENFGLLLPAMVGLVGLVCWRFRKKIVENNAWKSGLAVLLSALAMLLIFGLFVFMADDPASLQRMPLWLKLLFLVPLAVFAGLTIMAFQPVRSFVFDSLAFVLPAAGIFLFAIFVKTAPWGWDNTKLIIWAYFISLPFLWRDLIKQWPMVGPSRSLLPPFHFRFRLPGRRNESRHPRFRHRGSNGTQRLSQTFCTSGADQGTLCGFSNLQSSPPPQWPEARAWISGPSLDAGLQRIWE